MKILLVEDNQDDLFLASRELGQLGHELVGAVNGELALEIYRREKPDLVVTDVFMPGMDGFALTRAVQDLAAPNWQPVIFLTGHRDDELQVRALEIGADAYIIKPVAAEMLAARLRVIDRLLAMQRQTRERAAELERYQAAEEEEKRIARHLIDRLMSAAKLNDPAIRHWIAPASSFSGDIVAAGRTPGGVLHALLADGTGHGLAASINVLPIIAPFYRMTEKGFGIEAIARELNSKVRQLLPHDRFVAATLVAVDFREGLVRVWNGGNPAPLLVSRNGQPERVFPLRHVPLGVLDDDEFESNIEVHAFSESAELVLFSDGVLEAENAAGEMFGNARLAGALAAVPGSASVERVAAALRGHLGVCDAHDDISLMAIVCRSELGAPERSSATAAQADTDPGNWHFSLRLGANDLRRMDVVPVLLGLASHFEVARERTGELFLILSELFNNALDHGLLRLESRAKLGPDGMERFLEQRSQRLAVLEDGEIELELGQFAFDGNGWLSIVCRDSGPGFDHAAPPQQAPVGEELPYGRGIDLVRSIATRLEFNDAGNEVRVTLPLHTSGAADCVP